VKSGWTKRRDCFCASDENEPNEFRRSLNRDQLRRDDRCSIKHATSSRGSTSCDVRDRCDQSGDKTDESLAVQHIVTQALAPVGFVAGDALVCGRQVPNRDELATSPTSESGAVGREMYAENRCVVVGDCR
jgi:hypothetical protein